MRRRRVRFFSTAPSFPPSFWYNISVPPPLILDVPYPLCVHRFPPRAILADLRRPRSSGNDGTDRRKSFFGVHKRMRYGLQKAYWAARDFLAPRNTFRRKLCETGVKGVRALFLEEPGGNRVENPATAARRHAVSLRKRRGGRTPP
jgi:hypothetical protein